jgi:hypothetical protein
MQPPFLGDPQHSITYRVISAGTKKVKAAASKGGSKAGTTKSSPLASFFDK